MAMYEVKKAREQKALEAQERLLEMQEMQMLMLEPNLVTDPVRAEIIRQRQALITKKYQQRNPPPVTKANKIFIFRISMCCIYIFSVSYVFCFRIVGFFFLYCNVFFILMK